MKNTKKLLFTFIISIIFSLSSCVIVDIETTKRSSQETQNASKQAQVPKNIVMVIADGMGPAYVTAYRFYMDDPTTEVVEHTVLDQHLVGTARTQPHQTSGYITDSASSATAMSAGVKTYNGAIGVDINKQPLETVLHRAHKYGMQTGLAVTSQIVHASPAAFMVANEARRNYNQIADSYYDDTINSQHLADVMLGGGWRYFLRDDRNLVAEFKQSDYQYVDSYNMLEALKPSENVLGLFADTGLPSALDDTDPHRLRTLTQSAVKHLENRENGFFLLVEASQVDWAGHGNDIASAMAEMDDLAKTMEFLYAYAESHPDTLVILTADHSTGGLTIASDGEYRWSPEFLKGHKQSINSISKVIRDKADPAAYFAEQVGYSLDDKEEDIIKAINADMTERQVAAVLKGIVDKRSNTGWTTSGHTGVDVNVYAFGPGAELFKDNQENTDIAHKIFRLLDEKFEKDKE